MWRGPVFSSMHVVLLLCSRSLFGLSGITAMCNTILCCSATLSSLIGNLLSAFFGTFLGSLCSSQSSLVSSLLSLAGSTFSGQLLGVLGNHLEGDLNSNFLVQANDTGVLARGLDALVNAHDLAVNIVTSLLGIGFHLCQLVSLLTQVLGMNLQCTGRCQDGLALGNEIVAAIAVLHFHNVVLETKIDDIFFQNNLHSC